MAAMAVTVSGRENLGDVVIVCGCDWQPSIMTTAFEAFEAVLEVAVVLQGVR